MSDNMSDNVSGRMEKKAAGKHKVYSAEDLEKIKEEGKKLRECLVENFERVYREEYRNYGQAAEKIGGISGVSLSQYVSGITRIPDRQLLKICNALEIATQSIRENDIYKYDEYYMVAIRIKYLIQKQNIITLELLAERTGIPEEYLESVTALNECNLKKNDIQRIAEVLQTSVDDLETPWNDINEANQDSEYMKYLYDNWASKGTIIPEFMTLADNFPITGIIRQYSLVVGEVLAADDAGDVDVSFLSDTIIRLMEESVGLLKEKGVTLDDATKLKLIKLLTE